MQPIRDQTFAISPQNESDLGFYCYIPSTWDGQRWIVSIHGYTRNAAAHITQLAKEAAFRQCAVVAPIFPRAVFGAFQTLSPSKEGVLPEDAFERCVARAQLLLGVGDEPAVLGYSGGGQFLHRYLMMREGACRRAVLFAPGWYTSPDADVPYPCGTGSSQRLLARTPNIENLASVPTTVLVGTNDVCRDGTLNTDPKITELQGPTRVERAQRWVDAMNEALGVDAITLRVLSGIGHDFSSNVKRRGLAKILFDELLMQTSEKNNA